MNVIICGHEKLSKTLDCKLGKRVQRLWCERDQGCLIHQGCWEQDGDRSKCSSGRKSGWYISLLCYQSFILGCCLGITLWKEHLKSLKNYVPSFSYSFPKCWFQDSLKQHEKQTAKFENSSSLTHVKRAESKIRKRALKEGFVNFLYLI